MKKLLSNYHQIRNVICCFDVACFSSLVGTESEDRFSCNEALVFPVFQVLDREVQQKMMKFEELVKEVRNKVLPS